MGDTQPTIVDEVLQKIKSAEFTDPGDVAQLYLLLGMYDDAVAVY